ncbi:MAG: vWA domain-containing protein, partial [Planctomycetota bacterium]
ESGWKVSGETVSPGSDLHLHLEYPPLDKPEIVCHRLPSNEKGFFLNDLQSRPPESLEDAGPMDLAVFVDTSLSRAGLAAKLQLKAVDYVLSQLEPGDRFSVTSCDSATRPIGAGDFQTASHGARARALSGLSAILPLGGSDQESAVATMARLASSKTPGRRLAALWITDGMATLGRREIRDITAPLAGPDEEAA